MRKNACDFCGCKLGLIIHRLGRYRFHTERCRRLFKDTYIFKVRLLYWLRHLATVPP